MFLLWLPAAAAAAATTAEGVATTGSLSFVAFNGGDHDDDEADGNATVVSDRPSCNVGSRRRRKDAL